MTLEEKLKKYQEKIKQNPLTSVIISITLLLLLLIVIPYLQVDYRGINNATQEATLENQYRATFAQILGGVAIGIGLYYTWRRIAIAEEDLKATQKNLEVIQEGQITERFTRAIEQLGNEKLEIRLGGIYALERIANESEKDYWPIMEILTAYVRKNSHPNMVKTQINVSLDIQAVLTVIGRRKNSFNHGESKHLNLQMTFLQKGELSGAHLEGAHLKGANLSEAKLEGVYLEGANLEGAYLKEVNLNRADLEKATLCSVYLVGAYLNWVNFKGANLDDAKLENANLLEANFEVAILAGANLAGARFISAHLGYANLINANLVKTSF
jgi:uncharacterized protein YjbI with pentapeptide repeats